MRALRIQLIAVCVLASCAKDRGSPSKKLPADAAVLDAAPQQVTDEPSAGAHLIEFQPLPLDTALPDGASTGAALVGGARWIDRGGRTTLYLIERASADRTRVAMSAILEQGEGLDRLRLRELKDQAACSAPSPSGFGRDVDVTDLDGDGDAEVWLGYLVGCGDDDTPTQAKQLVLEGRSKYVVGGDGPLDGKAEPDAAAWPPGWLDRAIAGYERRAATIAAHPAAAEALDTDDFATIEIDRPGDVAVRISYPDLAPLPSALARELTARMRTFLRADHRYAAGLVGNHEADCEVTLAVPELVSIVCRRRIEPGDDTRETIVVWRAPGLPAVALDELLSAAVLQPACGPTAPTTLWVVEPEGVSWVPGDDPAPPPGCADGFRWSELRPTSDRARAMVARMLPASDP